MTSMDMLCRLPTDWIYDLLSCFLCFMPHYDDYDEHVGSVLHAKDE